MSQHFNAFYYCYKCNFHYRYIVLPIVLSFVANVRHLALPGLHNVSINVELFLQICDEWF